MTWSLETSNGNESAKIRFEIVPYVQGEGLDLGCGPWKVFPHVIGVDAQPGTAANVMRDVTDLKIFADEHFDFVYSSHTLEDQVDTVATLREWWRVIKQDGHLILCLPHKDYYPNVGQPGANPAHVHDFVPADIIAAMREVGGGWDLVECQERNGGNEYSMLLVFRKTARGFAESWQAPRPEKKAAVVRYGAIGDALWASSILPALKADGYHITIYTQEAGADALRHDPHVDRIIVHAEYMTPPYDMIPYWLHEKPKYDRWINLVQSVEARLLPAPHDIPFHWSDEQRRRRMNENYLECVHEWAGVPYEPRQKFYPTADELAWAKAKREEFDGPVVMLQPAGSTWPKWWPYTERFAAMLADRGVHCVIVGDYRGLGEMTRDAAGRFTGRLGAPVMPAHYGHFIGRDWPVRNALTFATLVDAIVGEESSMVNAAAFEDNFKLVLLSHSTHENLTRDWVNTAAIAAEGLPCYPCHRLHSDASFCTFEKHTQSAGCQAVLTPEKVFAALESNTTFLREREAA